MTTPAALPAAAPRPVEHLLRQVRTGRGWWWSLHGRQAAPVIGGEATLAGGPTVLPGSPTGLTGGCLSPRFYGHGVSSCGGARLCAAAEPIGAREAVNNQPRSIPATSRADSPAPPRPPRSPGNGVRIPPLRLHHSDTSVVPSLAPRGRNACPKEGKWQRTGMGSVGVLTQLRPGGVWLLGV